MCFNKLAYLEGYLKQIKCGSWLGLIESYSNNITYPLTGTYWVGLYTDR